MIKIQWLASIWRQNDQKCSVTSQNIQNYAKLQNRSNYIELHRLDGKTIKTKLNYKSDQNPMTCIDLRSKRSKCRVTSRNIQNNAKLQNRSNYNELHRLDVKTIKQLKTTKAINLQWLASIICQNDQNKAKLQKWSKYNDLHRFYVKTIKMLKTTQNYKTDQITMICIDWMSKRSKQRKTTKVIKLQGLAWIICQNDQNNGKLQNRSNYIELHRLYGKTIKTKLNYNSDRNPMTCIDLTSKR